MRNKGFNYRKHRRNKAKEFVQKNFIGLRRLDTILTQLNLDKINYSVEPEKVESEMNEDFIEKIFYKPTDLDIITKKWVRKNKKILREGKNHSFFDPYLIIPETIVKNINNWMGGVAINCNDEIMFQTNKHEDLEYTQKILDLCNNEYITKS